MSGDPRFPDELAVREWRAFERWALKRLGAHEGIAHGRGGHDQGIDGVMPDGRPIQIKFRHKLTAAALREFAAVLQREKKKAGILVALSFTGKTRHEASLFREQGVEIDLLTEPDLRGAKKMPSEEASPVESLGDLESGMVQALGVEMRGLSFLDLARLSRLARHHAAAEAMWREAAALTPERAVERDQLLATRRAELAAADKCEAALAHVFARAVNGA